MNQIKTLGLFVILPLFAIALTPENIGFAFAANVGSQDVIGRPGYDPGKVCGDRLCSEVNKDSSDDNKKDNSKTNVRESSADTTKELTEAYAEISYSVKIGDDRYFIHYNICAADEPINNPQIILESELETVKLAFNAIIYENACQNFESVISTKSPELVKISVLE